MKSHLISRLQHLKSTLAVAVLLAAFAAVCAVGIVSSTAQSTQKEERELEDKIPKHLPLKIKVKNLNNGKWTHDLEVEVTNTGAKPIYYLRLGLYFDDVKMENGDHIGFPLRYGRPDLYIIENKATSEDVPIKPGETYIFTAPKSLANYWEKFRVKHNMAQPKKIGIEFHALNYGDGTGFHTLGGLPVPAPPASKSSGGSQKSDGSSTPPALNTISSSPPDSLLQLSFFPSPVMFLPASFFSPVKIIEDASRTPPVQSGLCCPSTSCFKMRSVLGGNCFCSDDPPVSTADVLDCNAFGVCGAQITRQDICDSDGHTCTNFFIQPCPTLPPSTSTPTPTPCPTLDDKTQPNPTYPDKS